MIVNDEINDVGSDDVIDIGSESNSTEPMTYSREDVDKMLKENDEKNQKAFDAKFDKRWGNKVRSYERENAKRDGLIDMFMKNSKAETLDDLIKIAENQYDTKFVNMADIKDQERLGRLDAQDLIEMGDDSVKGELTRLSGISDLGPREKILFDELTSYQTKKENEIKKSKEFKEAGIDDEIANSKEFNEFYAKYGSNATAKEVFDLYNKINSIPPVEPPFNPGSNIGNTNKIGEVKEFYSFEEAQKFTRKDFDANPKLFEAVQRSMHKWSSGK